MDRDFSMMCLIRGAALVALLWLGWSPASLAQGPEKPARIGLIAFGERQMRELWEQTFIDGLRERGYVEGKNLVIERRHAEGSAQRMPEIAAELAALRLDAIVTTCTPSTRVMHQASRATPLVMAAVSDPVGQGLIASYSRPGGYITGLASQFEDIAAKMLALLRESVPSASPVAVLVNARNPVHPTLLRELEAAARPLNVTLVPVEVGLQTDLPATFARMARDGILSVLVLPDDPTLIHLRRKLAEQAIKHRMPSFFGLREAVEDGGLMSYGENVGRSYHRAAYYVDRVVRGANPGDLPVEQPTRFEFVINLRTAKTLGLAIPQSILLRADEVIQ
jgi:putative ABC transport system substrate-binding protein